MLTDEQFEADEEDGWAMAAVMARLIDGWALYRAPADHVLMFLVLGRPEE